MKLKEIKRKTHYIVEFDINVNDYLTYAEVQQIVNAVEAQGRENDTWADRQTNIDMLVLFHATNIGKDKLEELGHEALLTSGVIDAVNNHVANLCQIYEAIGFTESMRRAGTKFIVQLGKMLESDNFKKVLDLYGKQTKK